MILLQNKRQLLTLINRITALNTEIASLKDTRETLLGDVKKIMGHKPVLRIVK